jgi:HlyD family secretion protein
MKGVLWTLAALVVLGALAWWLLGRGEADEVGTRYRTARAARGVVVEGVEASGTVQPLELIQVGTQVSGTIEAILVDFNSKVHAGETIARLDSRRLAAQVAQDEAAQARSEADQARSEALAAQAQADVVRTEALVAQAQAEVERVDASRAQAHADVERVLALHVQAKADLERQRALVERRISSRSDYDAAVAAEASLAAQVAVARAAVRQGEAQRASALAAQRQQEAQRTWVAAALRAAQAQIRVAQATVRQGRAQLESDRVNLGYATIVAPVDGIVVSRNVEVGQTVAASLQAPTLFVIARDLTHVQVEAAVPEADIGRVKEGQHASFGVDAFPERSFEGVVSQVRLAATTVSNVVTYTAVVRANNPDGLLFPGMTALVTFEIDRSPAEALHVPSTALRLQPPAAWVAEVVPASRAHAAHPQGGSDGVVGVPAPAAPTRLGTVFVPRADGRLTAVTVRTGLSDGISTVVEPLQPSALTEGTEVVTAILKAAEPTATNPFLPALRRGGRR